VNFVKDLLRLASCDCSESVTLALCSEVESLGKLADLEETRPGCVDSKIVPPITCQLQPEEWRAGSISLLFAFVAKDPFPTVRG
jgi:hypothetical protein